MYIKKLYLLFVFFFLLINLQGQVARVIIDADTGNDIDDMPSIVFALKSGKVDVLALTAAQWHRFEVCGRQTMNESWVDNNRILRLLGMEHIPSLKGSEFAVKNSNPWGDKSGSKSNEASDYIIEKALEMPNGEKLIVIVTGSATNVAYAILTEPKIVEKITVYFIGTTYDFDRKAFNKNEPNVRSDLNAVDIMFNTENLELHIMPANITRKLLVYREDIDGRLKSDDGIDNMLKELWNRINKGDRTWVFWDLAIVQAVLNPQWTKQILTKTPPENTPRDIYLYTEIDSKAMMDDFWKVFLK
jgi:inosine-uridine nucleoside N-ribohydrolase